jgi:hypothetical protein
MFFMSRKMFILFLISLSGALFQANAEEFKGKILSAKDNTPIAYVNIGVVGRNVGTVSDAGGNYSLHISEQYDRDTLKISCIGFKPYTILVGDYKKRGNNNVFLDENVIDLSELAVFPKKYKQKTFGIKTKNSPMVAGFEKNALGYEAGLKFSTNKKTFLEKLRFNVASCDYDTIFYRINVYEKQGKRQFENILTKPVYLFFTKEKIKEGIEVDLSIYNIIVQGDFLVTLEHVREMGDGRLYFPASLKKKTYYRKTSQGEWNTAPAGIAMSLEALVEE